MNRYITLGADENGEVYGLELGEDGKWKRNSLGLSTSCAVVRPMSKETYEYLTDDPFDASFVFELLDNESNPTVAPYGRSDANDGSSGFREHLKKALLESPDTTISCEDDVYNWECSGWFPPKKPFVIEFAPKELLDEYYAHLRKTSKEFEG